MKHLSLLLVVFVFLLVSSCDTVNTDEFVQDEVTLKSGKTMLMNFRAHLTGAQEVPPVESMATGEAIFQLSKDGTMLSYKLIVANIVDVKASHIHLAPMGANGGVIAPLYTNGLIPGTTNGILAEGVINVDESIVENIMAGNTYVNVHTNAFGGGEIRGQIH